MPPDGRTSGLAHERGCEAELARRCSQRISRWPSSRHGRTAQRFALRSRRMPEVVVHLAPLIDYEALLGATIETWQDAEVRHETRASTPPG